mmetsp:Transcript_69182/g.109204  ORF Transcript_69182/g.109204 Transcript_69182/m.109204 type:complete len:240 (+) Transcript_69182:66-785(+)
MSCRPATQCCCGCSLEFGSYSILGLNLVRCLVFILMACDAVMHTENELYMQIQGSLADKVFLAALSMTGATFTVLAIYGVSVRMPQAVLLAWYFFVLQFVLDVSGVLWESLIHASCDDIPANLASGAVHPFACGVERSLWIISLLMVIVIEGYCLFILHCYCEDAMLSVPTKPFEDLYSRAETHILAKHLNPYNHLYGALPSPDALTGEAVMAGVPMESTYQIFNGTYHDMSFPPRSNS